ncbi:MAG: class I SAM-dependent methyltransferase [Deferribacteraceae bacterium]|jgi:ubiquinone/menaquinone biosynthesis C-methylase UbiE|nr:class I SAM-dependent methyltransferase [Deferribacteraceae bacterium]
MREKTCISACPWWFCPVFDNIIRERFQKPFDFLTPLVKAGFRVLDIGPGRGYCTFPLAALIKPDGIVYALDIQKKMLDILQKRAVKGGYSNVITHLYDGKDFNLQEEFDFVNLFWMFHEIRNKDTFLKELKRVCKAGCSILLTEPYIHVSKKEFGKSVQLFQDNGFNAINMVKIRFSRAVLFEKN